MSAGKTHRTADVFGIQRDVPENYVTRSSVDDVFVESLSRDKHIVVFGSSKQGKTSLRKYNLKPEDYIAVTCWNTANLGQLHSAILKEAGYTIEQSITRTASGLSKINAKISGGLNLGVARIGADAGTESSTTEEIATTELALELDPADVNDIIRALQEVGFHRYIVLEDFHYLPTETQRAFASALKAFHEGSSLTFVVVGVWLDENRLIQYNGDLTGRVIAVDADAWSSEELASVIRSGEALLNIAFDEQTIDELLTGCFESVYIVQEACYRLCVNDGIALTQAEVRLVGEGANVDDLVRKIVEEQSARYDTFLSKFAEGFQETSLEMYKWILLPILMVEARALEKGITWSTLRAVINSNHPAAPINPGNLIQALSSVASLQARTNINPLILDYDQTRRRLNVVDKGFLIWLNYQERETLLDTVGLPTTPKVPPGFESQFPSTSSEDGLP
jgi:hypothetical protein